MLGDVCAIVMGGHHRPLSSLAVLIVIIFVIEQSLFVASQINQTAAAYQVNINSVCHGFRRTKQDDYFQVTFDHF